MLTAAGNVVFQEPWKDHGHLACSFWPEENIIYLQVWRLGALLFLKGFGVRQSKI